MKVIGLWKMTMNKEYKDLDLAKAVRESVSHLWKNENWIAEKKHDGHRALIHIGNPCSRLYMTSRKNEECGKCVSQFAPQIDVSGIGYTVFDGEVIPPAGEEFHILSSYLRVSSQVAQTQRKKTGEITYKAFDILFLNGQDVRNLPLEMRIKLLEMTLAEVFPNHPFVQSSERAFTNTYDFFLSLVEKGGEGVVLKNLKCGYGGGWIKGKRNSTVDVIVCGFEEGYDMKHGVFKIAVLKPDGNVMEIGKCGILNEQVRIAVNKDPMSFVGQVAELKCLKFDPVSGKIREPIFQRMRPDLSPLDATLEKLLRDVAKVNID